MTTLSGGYYGPPIETKHTEKTWPPDNYFKRQILISSNIIKTDFVERDLRMSLESKFYGAEYYDDLL